MKRAPILYFQAVTQQVVRTGNELTDRAKHMHLKALKVNTETKGKALGSRMKAPRVKCFILKFAELDFAHRESENRVSNHIIELFNHYILWSGYQAVGAAVNFLFSAAGFIQFIIHTDGCYRKALKTQHQYHFKAVYIGYQSLMTAPLIVLYYCKFPQYVCNIPQPICNIIPSQGSLNYGLLAACGPQQRNICSSRACLSKG